jgi:AcrR family transcriptional regulator
MVSRAAFYRNHRDKYQLVEQIFDEAMAEMTTDDGTGTRSPDRRFADFLGHIDTCHRLYRALLGRNGSPWFARPHAPERAFTTSA